MNALGQALVWCAVQVTLVAAAAAVVYAALRNRGPALRSLVALTGLAISVALTLAAFSPWPRWRPPAEIEPATHVARTEGQPAAAVRPGAEPAAVAGGQAVVIDPSLADTVSTFWEAFVDELEHRPQTVQDSPRWSWLSVVSLLFAIGVALGALRLVAAWLVVCAYRRFSGPVQDPGLTRLAAEIAADLGCRRRIELRECPQLSSAAMLGWRRPLVLLPAEWPQWSDAERRAVLAHEIAHASRGDFAAWACAQFGLLLHFYHPLVHWLAARLRLDQELAADAAAADIAGGRQPYLRILADMALRQSDRLAGWPARAFLPTRRTFLRRIEMLRATKQVPAAASRRACAVTVGVLVLAGLAAAGLRGSSGAVLQAQDDSRPRLANQPNDEGPSNPESGGLYTGFIPNETQSFIAIRPAALLSRPEMKPLADFLSSADAGRTMPFNIDIREIEQMSWTVIPPVHSAPRMQELGFPFGALTLRATRPQDFQKLIEDVAPNATPVPASGREYFISQEPGGMAYFRPDDRTIVLGNVQDVARMIATGPEAKWARLTSGPIAEAIADAHYVTVIETSLVEALFRQARGTVQQQQDRARRAAARQPGVAVPPNDALNAAMIKESVSLSAFAPLWKQAESITFALKLDDRLALDWLFTSENEDDAEAVRRTVDALLTLGGNMSGNLAEMARQQTAGQPGAPAVSAALKLAEELLANAEATREGENTRLSTQAAVEGAQAAAVATLTDSIKVARTAARRAQSSNNLKQIALAFHNYHDQYGRFPPAVLYGPDGKTPHSWRVAILPYLDQEALYRQYRLDEPWDSPNNRKIAEVAMPIFRHPDAPQDSKNASYFALVGETTIFTGNKAEGNKAGMGFQHILDGTSNTILVVEAKRDIPWTKPEDIPFDSDQTVPELGGFTAGGFHAALADGSVRFFAEAITPATLKALITRAGGEPVDPGNIPRN